MRILFRHGSRLVVPLVAVTAIVLSAGPSWALPAVQQVNTNPTQLELNRRTDVRITAVVSNTAEIFSGAFNLERLNPNGTVLKLGQLKDDGSKGDVKAGDGIYTLIQNFNEPQVGIVNLRVAGLLVLKSDRSRQIRVESEVFRLPVGVVLPAGSGGTIPGPGGTSVTVQPGTFSGPTLVSINPVPASRITAPTGSFSLIAAVELIIEPVGFADGLGPAAFPLNISVPRPAGVTDTEFIIGEQVIFDSITGTPGLKPQFISRAMAAAVGGNIVTQPSALSGIQHAGVHAILGAIGSAIVTGTVFNPGGVPAAGVVVSSNTNTAIHITDQAGQYSLFVSGGAGGVGPFTVSAFHPLRGSAGSTNGVIQTHGSTINNVDITLVPLAAPPVTRDGVRNGGFERCLDPVNADGHGNLAGSWAVTGSASAVTQFVPIAPTTPGFVILPTEGGCMLDFNTGPGAVGAVGSSLKQSFIVPAGVRQLKVDFNFVSEEFPEFVGTQFNDTFHALVTTPGGQTEFATVSVNDSGGFSLIGDCFPAHVDPPAIDGDATCGTTGWRTGTVDLSAYAGTGTPVEVELLFSVEDRGDNIYDTHVLVDNIRFGTVWVDAKIRNGANATIAGAESDVRLATEILSQAGINVRLRPAPPALATGPLDPNLDYVDGGLLCSDPTQGLDPAQRDGHRTQDEITLLAQARSPVQTDVNLYYARTAIRTDGFLISGYAIGTDEFCHEVNFLTSSGVVLLDRRLTINNPGVLAHEIGHLLISPANATSTLEHNAGSTNFMNGSGTLATAILGRNQSTIVNRAGSPLVCQEEDGDSCP